MNTEVRVALVTGAGKKRVGWYVADTLAGRGMTIAVHYHTSAQGAAETVQHLRARGVSADAFQADLGDEAAVSTMVERIRAQFGRIDVLVNAAAIWERIRLEDITAVDVRRHFDANVLGTFLTSRAVGLAMVGQPEGGCIVTMGDWAEARPYRDFAAYFASKGAIPALTRCLAVELGTRNPRVRVNAILPGPVLFQEDLPAAEREVSIWSTLVRHEGSPANIARAVCYLLDDDFVTGSCLTVDGGRSVYAGGGAEA